MKIKKEMHTQYKKGNILFYVITGISEFQGIIENVYCVGKERFQLYMFSFSHRHTKASSCVLLWSAHRRHVFGDQS